MKTKNYFISLAVACLLLIGMSVNAQLIVNEPFNYTLATVAPAASTGINGGNGLPATNVGGNPAGTSTGIRGSWSGSTVVAGLTYSNGGGTLTTSGNALKHTTSGQEYAPYLYRNMTTDPFMAYRSALNSGFGWVAAPTELYISFLINVSTLDDAGIPRMSINGLGNRIYIAQQAVSGTSSWIASDGFGNAAKTLGNAAANKTELIVVRLNFKSATTCTTDFWFNPTLGAALGAPVQTRDYTVTAANNVLNDISLRGGTNFTVDEIRVGVAAADVLPYTAVIPDPTAPDAPTGIVATAGNAQASVAFTVPANGGSAITGYTVTSNPGSITATGSSSPIVVTGLTNGTAYTFTVTATNAIGTSDASSASAAVTPAVPTSSLIAYEGFDGSFNSGTGWSANWTSTGSSNVSSAGLVFGTLLNIGNYLQTAYFDATRTLTNTLTAGEDMWVSYICSESGENPTTGSTSLSIQNPSASLNFNNGAATQTQTYMMAETPSYAGVWTTPESSAGITFNLIKISPTKFERWIYKVTANLPTTAPAANDANAFYYQTVTKTFAAETVTTLKIKSYNNATVGYDEIRIGKAFADVVPVSGMTTELKNLSANFSAYQSSNAIVVDLSTMVGQQNVTIFDIQGKNVFNHNVEGGKLVPINNTLKQGIYLVKVSNASNTNTVKLFVK